MCSLYNGPFCSRIKTNINKFAISSHTTLKLAIQVLRKYLKLRYEDELYTLPSTKAGPAKEHGENYMKVFCIIVYYMTNSYRPGIKKFDWFKAGL